MNKRIIFLMPGSGRKPAGGYKVVYEYANRLDMDGYQVKIVYPASLFFYTATLKEKLKSILRYFYYLLWGFKGNKWFSINHSIKESLVPSLSKIWVGKADIYVATSVQTAMYLKKYSIGEKIYLIQDYENWFVSDKQVNETYRYGFHNIVISDWLHKKVTDAGANAVIIKNGFDFYFFKFYKSLESRNPLSISMLYHNDERKGCKYGLEALEIVRLIFPNITATLFGVPTRPSWLPDWIKYYQQPDKITFNKIYNNSAIYLAPSLTEGWGLTVGEAMICGASIVCTDTLGFREMVKNEVNGLIVPIADSKALAKALIKLITNQSYRINLAKQGMSSIRSFNWDLSYKKFKEVIDNLVITNQ